MINFLRDIPPSSPINHAGDSFAIDTIFEGERLEGNVFALVSKAYFDNLVFIKFGISLCASLCLSSLAYHVQAVIGFCAKPEMRGVTASGIVTTGAIVKYAQVFWNGAILQFIAIAMHVYILTLNVYASVAKLITVARPFPTTVFGILVDVLPKTVFGGASSVMSSNIAVRLTLNPSARLVGKRHWLRGLTAATLAEFNRGVVRGMIRHVDTFLSRFGHAAGRFQRRCGASISSFNYSTSECFSPAEAA